MTVGSIPGSIMKSYPVQVIFREYLEGIIAAVFLAAFLRIFVFNVLYIPTDNMKPGLEKGDFVLGWKLAYGFQLPLAGGDRLNQKIPSRGDVVAFRFPGDEEQHSDSDTQEKKLKEDELIGPDEEKNGKGAESQGSFEQKLKNASEDANGRTYTIATPRRADNGSLSSQTANNNIEMLLSVSVERSLVESLSQQHAMVHNLTW